MWTWTKETWSDEVDRLAWLGCLDLQTNMDGEREAAYNDHIEPMAFYEHWARRTDKEEWARTGKPYYVNADGSPKYPENAP